MATRPNRSDSGGGGSARGWGAWLSYWGWRRWRSGGKRRPGDAGGPPRASSAVRQRSMERGHEPEEGSESVGGVVASAVLLVVSVAVVVGALVIFYSLLTDRSDAPLQGSPIAWVADAFPASAFSADIFATDIFTADVPPRPRLQVDPAIDLQDMHRREHERLYTYGRLDSARLHIPIGRAMRLVNERGLPVDTAGSADTLLVPTESGFRIVSRRFPVGPYPAAFLGSSPETYTPAPALRRYLTEEGYLPRPDSAR